MIQRVLEAAGQQLPFKINGNQARAGVNVLVAGHGSVSESDLLMTLDIPFGSQQNAVMNELFLQRRWLLSHA